MNEKKSKKTDEPLMIIENYVKVVSDIKMLWLDVRKEEMVDSSKKESPDDQFAAILSNGITVRASWIRDLRLGRAREKTRVHKTFTATNNLIEKLNAELAEQNIPDRDSIKPIDIKSMIVVG